MIMQPGRLFLYWDYELQAGADAARAGGNQWGIEDYRQTERILDLLDQYQVKSTFAVLGFAALAGDLPYHAPSQIRNIAERGHEVASHTWKHEWVPSLSYPELVSVLQRSKNQLESVTNRPVISFVPPWNAPFTYLRKTSLGFYDWKVGRPRIDIPTLCRALQEVGYKTARIAYEPFHLSLIRNLFGKTVRKPAREQWINGILCFKVSSGGFGANSLDVVRQAAQTGKNVVIFAHPHSLILENAQNLSLFMPFLDLVRELRDKGNLEVATPGEIYNDR